MNNLNTLLIKVKSLFEEENFLFEPEGLYAPIDYALSMGGKRIRPVMLMAAHEVFGGNADNVRNAALGIETYHNFTLLHDDLMDRSPLRRGKPTVYTKWDDNTAILSGDTMVSLAWRYFLRDSSPNLHAILNTFNETCIEVCEGQQYDMDFEKRIDVRVDEYMEMIRLKTAVLLASALKIGALYANATATDVQAIYYWGIHIGLAFQLQDDLLDAYGDVATFGKQTGTDIKDNKKTFLYLSALAHADAEKKSRLLDLFNTTPADPSDKIAEVLDIYKAINIKAITEEAIRKEFDAAKECLAAIQVDEDHKLILRELADALLGREK